MTASRRKRTPEALDYLESLVGEQLGEVGNFLEADAGVQETETRPIRRTLQCDPVVAKVRVLATLQLLDVVLVTPMETYVGHLKRVQWVRCHPFWGSLVSGAREKTLGRLSGTDGRQSLRTMG